MKPKIFVVGGTVVNWHEKWTKGESVPFNKAEIVIFTGGPDIDPVIYGEARHPQTEQPNHLRDKTEIDMAKECIKQGIPMVGICRGAQLLCAMAGGKLVQHQQNKGNHKMHVDCPYEDGEGVRQHFYVTSCHHQAQWPWGLGHSMFRLLGWTYDLSEFHEDWKKDEMVIGKANLCQWGGGRAGNNLLEVEDAYYPMIRALAIQCHPEWMGEGEEFKPGITHYRKLIDMLLKGEL